MIVPPSQTSSSACRREPAPLSLVLVTVRVTATDVDVEGGRSDRSHDAVAISEREAVGTGRAAVVLISNQAVVNVILGKCAAARQNDHAFLQSTVSRRRADRIDQLGGSVVDVVHLQPVLRIVAVPPLDTDKPALVVRVGASF